MRHVLLTFALLWLAAPLAAQTYPPEGQPIEIPRQLLWLEVVPDVEIPADASQQIDVLYIIASSVTTSQATADGLCASYEQRENEVLANDPANISRVHKVGCRIIDYVGVNGSTDFTFITSGAGRATAEAWRTELGADVVQFLTPSGDSCGLGYQCAANSGAAFGYSWVSSGCAVGNYSIIHELGHNVCLAHDLPNQSPSYPYGSGFCDNVSPTFHGRRDPMVYPSPCGGSRVSYFGNPNISPFGYPFGDAATADNARVWRERAAQVAAFKSQIGPPICGTITLSPTSAPNGYTDRAYSQTFTASGGTAPYALVKTSGTVPAGLSFASATLAGTPTTAGVSNYTLQATDAVGCLGSRAYTQTILQLPTAPTNLQAVP